MFTFQSGVLYYNINKQQIERLQTMITLRTSLLSDNLGFNGEDIQVKTISAAWNKIREIRNTTEPNVLEGTILTIELPEGETSNRIPEKILFKMNTKGKMEFKDLAKVQARQEKKETKEKETSTEPVENTEKMETVEEPVETVEQAKETVEPVETPVETVEPAETVEPTEE